MEAITKRLATARSVLQKFMSPPAEPTIGEIIDSWDLSPILEAVEKCRPYNCLSIEHVDDYDRDDLRVFVWDVRYLAGLYFDEDGSYPEEFKDRLTVSVAPTVTVSMLVFQLNDQIQNLIEA